MKIRIDIPHHPYDIQIEKGCLAQAGQWLRELWQPQKVVIVTDNHVASLCGEGQTQPRRCWFSDSCF